MEKINLLGINVAAISRGRVLAQVENWLDAGGPRLLATVNPEMILEATGYDEEFFYILNKADLALPDGVGLKIAGWLVGANLTRVAGADLLKDLLKLAEGKGRRVAIFNWRHGLSKTDDIERALKRQYPGLLLLAVDIERDGADAETLKRAREFKPEMVFSTLGAPHQEKFLFHNLPNLPGAKIGLGVGGAFDFLTGRVRRAPKIMRLIGLEWLWRVYEQPWSRKFWRFKRIYNAVIVFPYKFFLWRFTK